VALKVDKSATFDRILKDPDDGTEYAVVLRKLTYGDIEDSRGAGVQIKRKGAKKSTFSVKLRDFFIIRKSVVSWEIPFPPVPKELEEVEGWLPKQLMGFIYEINPAFREELAAFEADEDEDEEDEDEEHSENGHSEVEEDTFEEFEGPTKPAVQS
jgi:hypothetical protein